MWTLVFIYLYAGEPFAVKYDTYENIIDCFYAREALGKEHTGLAGHFAFGTQAICIQNNDSV